MLGKGVVPIAPSLLWIGSTHSRSLPLGFCSFQWGWLLFYRMLWGILRQKATWADMRMFFPSTQPPKKRECSLCGKEKWVSKTLGVCADCIEENFSKAKDLLAAAHRQIREDYGLPFPPPRAQGPNTVSCDLCANECNMAPGDQSFCGLRKNEHGQLQSNVTADQALLHAYADPIPTNCCASWFCPAGTGRGYPAYAHTPDTEYGYQNLAVFLYGCNFDCFFCQNASHKVVQGREPTNVSDLVQRILRNERFACVCYFGGSPEPQLSFVLNLNRQILRKKEEGRILRICFEWNGAGNPKLVKKAAQQSLESGGIVKFDLKAPDSKLSFALSGVTNERVFRNFEMIYREYWHKHPDLPLLTASTLLVPGYIGPNEVERIAQKIARIDERIPYSLLVFHPDFHARDLPITPKKTARESYRRAKAYLEHVHLGNKHLLSRAPEEL